MTDHMVLENTVDTHPMRISLTIAIVVHLVLLFGLGFAFSLHDRLPLPTVLDITLVQIRSDHAPKTAEYIAQVNQIGSGTTDKQNNPRSPYASLIATALEGNSPILSRASSPKDESQQQPPVLTSRNTKNDPVPIKPERPDDVHNKPLAEELAEQTWEIAQLLAEMDEEEARYAKRPRIHFVSSVSAKSALEAAYIDAWVQKIERVGNMNYPDEAIRRRLNGQLILNVTLDHHGRVVDTEIDVSSGSKVLDKAALKIIKQASPYPPLPAEIRKTWDQLNITRTWIFHGSGSLDTR